MNDSELLNIFYVEVNEYLEALNNALLQVEMIAPSEAAYKAQVREMNRVAHSMKGAARTVGLSLIETIAHHMEEVFAAVQREELALTPDAADTLYDSLDLIQNAVDGEENNPDALSLVLANLEALMTGEPLLATDVTSDSRQMAIVHIVEDVAAQDALLLEGDGQIEKEVIPPIKADKKTSTHSRPTVIAPKMTQATATGQFTAVPVTDGGTMILRPAEETVRVTVTKLDQLMAEATELFVARLHGEEQGRSIAEVRRVHRRWQREWRTVRAAYIRLARRLQDEQQAISPELPILLKFLDTNQRYLLEMNRQLSSLAQSVGNYNMHLSALTDQLQDDISAMRMMPFESIVGGFQRMVRDLARDLDKQLQLEVIGTAVEIDKTVLEALKDPIMHLLRNAVDHAIETPEQRMRAGKSPVGRIEIGAEQRGSEIVLRVTDDGRGIDPERVRQSIVKSHLLTESEAAALSDDDARMYIFQSGLTTSDQVTSLSGRGLGMDIVRDRVESLRGRISLQSIIGEGTAVTLNVPVSLTRIRCVLLRISDQDYALPSAMVVRMEKLARSSIFSVEGREMILVNGRPIPLASLGAVLDMPSLGSTDGGMNIIVLQATDRAIAFEVDSLLSEQELVLKPLGPELAWARFVAGAALLGTGNVIIVLDANDLVRRASGTALPKRRTGTLPSVAPVQRRLRVLIVDDSITTRTLEKNILETAGYEVHVAVDGMEAWRILTDEDFDLVISDVEMPRMNGLELTTRIKSTSTTHHIPVILLTSLGKPEQREAGLHAGADAYLIKSRFDQGELLQMIRSVV